MVKINKPNLKFNGTLTPINKSKVTHIVQHHMMHPSWGINDVHNYHKNGNGWAGIGYNFWIAFDGTIYEGRGFNIGAHVKGHNSTSIGIGYQGDFTKQKMTDAQVKSGAELIKWLQGQLPKKAVIVGHKDLAATTCPGENFRMVDLKKAVNNNKPASKPVTKPSKPASDYKGDSIVDYLKSIGQDSSFANRAKLAAQHGIKNYKGTASQNAKLLDELRKGTKPAAKLYKVGGKVKIKSSAKKYSRANAAIPSKYKNKTYTIQQVGKDDVLLKELYSWVKKSDLQ